MIYILEKKGKILLFDNFFFFSYFDYHTRKRHQHDKILALTKFKAFANDNIMVTQKLKFVFERVENIVGKGENARYQHFLLFPQCLPTLSFL